MTATTQREEFSATAGDGLLMAIELGRREWKVGFTTRLGQRIRRRTLSVAGGTGGREGAPQSTGRCAGHELLRGRTGLILDPPVSHRVGCSHPRGGLVEH